MSSKKNYEFRSKEPQYGRNKDGLRQKRLKEDTRWRFNPNQELKTQDESEDEWFYDPEFDSRR